MPPHHPLFGHLLVANQIMSKLPPDAHPQYLPGQIRRAYPNVGPVFYLDMWPFSLPLLVVASPSAAYQLTQVHDQPKAQGQRNYMRPFTGNNDLVTLEGPEWKYWRNVFNPGFSSGHVMKLVPGIVEDVSNFCDVLQKHTSEQDMFSLEEVTVDLTIHSIGKIAL